MTYKHGAFVSEEATSIVPPVSVDSAIPVIVGCAPIHFLDEAGPINKPVIAYTYASAVAQLGYSSDLAKWNLCEFTKVMFSLFTVAPAIYINVFDPDKHKTEVPNESLTLNGDTGTVVNPGIISGSMTLKGKGVDTIYTMGVDYTVDRTSGTITRISTGGIAKNAVLTLAYSYGDPSKVTTADIIGGVDASTGKHLGLELLNKVFPMFGVVPGFVLSPGYSIDSAVAAVMHAKAGNVSGHFKCLALCDIDSNTVSQYDEVSETKNTNNLIDKQLVVCWPKVALSGAEYWLSSQFAALAAKVDADNDSVPYESPSNKSLRMDAAKANGEDVWLDPSEAQYLNGQGVVTALNFYGGWKLWGNRTSAYPSNTDVKDSFIPIRRMFNWIGNTVILTYWIKVDKPGNLRLIETVVDSVNMWLNGLAARGYILGGRVEFQTDENPTTDLMDGKIRFHVYCTPPSPAREFDWILEYDPDYVSTLFG